AAVSRPRLANGTPSLLLVPLAIVCLTCGQDTVAPPPSEEAPGTSQSGHGRTPSKDDLEDAGCLPGAPVRRYDVSAIHIVMTLNRFGDNDPDAFMYVLDDRIDDVRKQERKALPDRVTTGLRKDAIQPLVLRANLGECLVVRFTNRLTSDKASMHFHGLPHTAENAGGFTGNNPNTFAEPGKSVTYVLPLPSNREAERAYYVHDHGDARERINHGLFGTVVLEPEGSVYLDPETGEPLRHTNWEAIIQTPGPDPDFREHVIFYHEIGNESFVNIRTAEGGALPQVDGLSGSYRPGTRALNYRSEPFLNRLELKEDESLAYSSYPFGDPPTPIPFNYLGEPTKMRILHG
ncbi:MAG: multicopper oxidase domain-containing protein, partial [Myxococcaceae bacterium]|nr:multicopper oxidase domain-containing protein [Myxococcaceae bacterium]